MLTDFGTQDPYTGIMKGIVLGLCPGSQIVDLTHAVERHAVRQGAFLLAESVGYFPPATVFLAVVDPGVGGARRAIAAEAGAYRFVGPDNGLLAEAVRKCGGGRVVELANPAYRRSAVSTTFHRRDVFAPAAAYLASGVPLTAFGPDVVDPVQLETLSWYRLGGVILGEIVHIDIYGNLITSIGPMTWQGAERIVLSNENDSVPALTLTIAALRASFPGLPDTVIAEFSRTYSAGVPGALMALIGSHGRLEIACNQGSAAQMTGLHIGDAVNLILE
jgi:S-adenosylmethionine hydrolase